MGAAAMHKNNELFKIINELTNEVYANWGNVHRILSPLGTLDVEYHTSEEEDVLEGEEYADIALLLPDGVYAVTEDGYDFVYGIRIYLFDKPF